MLFITIISTLSSYLKKRFLVLVTVGRYAGLEDMLGWKMCWVGRYAGLEDMLGWKTCWVGRYAGLEDTLGWKMCWVGGLSTPG